MKLPALRERRSDIPALAAALLRRLEPELGRKQLSSDALAALVAHNWPGNVRELGSALYRAAALATGHQISSQHLAFGLRPVGPRRVRDIGGFDAQALLRSYDGNVSAAARAARMPRTTFRALLLKGELDAGRQRGAS